MFTFIWIVKMKLCHRLAIGLLLSQYAWCYLKTYKDFKLYSISCESQSDVEVLKFWEHSHLVDFWSRPAVNKLNQILVNPTLQPEFEQFLSYENFNYEILIENVGKLVFSAAPFGFSILKPSEYSQNIFSASFHSSSTIESRMTNKLKFHFQNGNFTDTLDRDFSHYWLLPEVNLEKKSFSNRQIFFKVPQTIYATLFNIFNRIWEWWTEWNQVRTFE